MSESDKQTDHVFLNFGILSSFCPSDIDDLDVTVQPLYCKENNIDHQENVIITIWR